MKWWKSDYTSEVFIDPKIATFSKQLKIHASEAVVLFANSSANRNNFYAPVCCPEYLWLKCYTFFNTTCAFEVHSECFRKVYCNVFTLLHKLTSFLPNERLHKEGVKKLTLALPKTSTTKLQVQVWTYSERKYKYLDSVVKSA